MKELAISKEWLKDRAREEQRREREFEGPNWNWRNFIAAQKVSRPEIFAAQPQRAA